MATILAGDKSVAVEIAALRQAQREQHRERRASSARAPRPMPNWPAASGPQALRERIEGPALRPDGETLAQARRRSRCHASASSAQARANDRVAARARRNAAISITPIGMQPRPPVAPRLNECRRIILVTEVAQPRHRQHRSCNAYHGTQRKPTAPTTSQKRDGFALRSHRSRAAR